MEEKLKELGLKDHEARVYLSLLKLGLTNAGPIISDCKLHRQQVYLALEGLQELKLVTVINKNNRKNFQACSPKNIIDIIDRKKNIAESLMPKLEQLHIIDEDQLEVQTFYGKKSFYNNLIALVDSAHKTSGVMKIVGGGSYSSFYDILGSQYASYSDYCRKKKIKKYLITSREYEKDFARVFGKEKNTSLKALDSVISSPTYTRITEDMVTIEIYTKEVVVIQIRNRAVAKSYLEHFNIMWGLA